MPSSQRVVRLAIPLYPPRAISTWSRSRLKRIFDLALVLCAMPAALPILLLVAVAVRLTSRGPILFRQKRTGLGGRAFTIYKFRSMPVNLRSAARPAITTTANQSFTPIGAFLRRWKLDELPQVFNVLRGDMSLVGPRPKLPQLHSGQLACRPGITGRATLVFAREECVLSAVPASGVDAFYCGVIRPIKQTLDDEYMATATFTSDLRLIARSLLHLFNDTEIASLLPTLARPVAH
jgi:lipopolysaccharide/colanic/teichoic acid biosynthesis glycosyltransferase